MSDSKAATTAHYDGDKFGPVHGGNVGGRHNTNNINNGRQESWESKLNRIKQTATTMNHRDLNTAEGVVMDVKTHIKKLQNKLKEVSPMLETRRGQLKGQPSSDDED